MADGYSEWANHPPPPSAITLGDVLQAKNGTLQVDADAVPAEELVADDAAELKPEQRARRVQVQHDHREVLVADGVEHEIDPGHQECVGIPARRAVDLQRNPAARFGMLK